MKKIKKQREAKVLTKEEIERLFNKGLHNDRDRTLFGLCLYAAFKISEACAMLTVDVYDDDRVRSHLSIRKNNSDGVLVTRSIPVHPKLAQLLAGYRLQAGEFYLFPGRHGRKHINPRAAALILKQACERVELTDISTHSLRHTALTKLSSTGTPLPAILAISGIESLAALQKYLQEKEVSVSAAIASLKF